MRPLLVLVGVASIAFAALAIACGGRPVGSPGSPVQTINAESPATGPAGVSGSGGTGASGALGSGGTMGGTTTEGARETVGGPAGRAVERPGPGGGTGRDGG